MTADAGVALWPTPLLVPALFAATTGNTAFAARAVSEKFAAAATPLAALTISDPGAACSQRPGDDRCCRSGHRSRDCDWLRHVGNNDYRSRSPGPVEHQIEHCADKRRHGE